MRTSLCSSQTQGRCNVAAPRRQAATRPCRAQASRLAWPQAQQGSGKARYSVAAAAVKDEDAAVEQMKREIEAGDVWDNEFVGTALKVALVAGIVAVSVFIANLGKPMLDNTLQSFPTPEAIQAYEDSK